MAKKSSSDPKPAPARKLSPGAIAIIVALDLILVAAIIFAVKGWNMTDAQVSRNGMIALTLGIVMSMLMGMVLMGLVFYSNRNGYDR